MLETAKFITTKTMMEIGNKLFVQEAPKIDEDAAKNAIGEIVTPLTDIAFWAVPVVAVLAVVISGLAWLTKDEEEKEQKPFIRTARRILITTAIIYFFPVITRVLGWA